MKTQLKAKALKTARAVSPNARPCHDSSRQEAVIWALGLSVALLPVAAKGDDDDDESARPYRQPLEELFLTEMVYPQEKGEWQATFLPSYHHERESRVWRLPLLLEYGLTERWELGMQWDAWVVNDPKDGSPTKGIGDLELETKYSFMNLRDGAWHAAVGFGLQLPTGSVNKDLGEGLMEYEPYVAIARDFPELASLQLFGQLGLSLVDRVRSARVEAGEEEEPAAHEVVVSAGFLFAWETVVPSCELTWSNNRWNHHGEENEWYLTPGLTWKLGQDWEAGLGVPIGLNRTSDHWRAVLQITKEF